MKIISLIGVILFSMSAISADFTIEVNPAANSIDDSKVSSLSISKITNLQSSLDAKASQSSVDSSLALKADSSSLGSLASKSTITNLDVADGALSSSKIASFASDVISAMSSTLSSYLQKSDLPVCSAGQYLRKSGASTYTCESPVIETIPSGMVMAFGGSTCPSNWLLADGAAVSRSTYANLFTAIGVAHGSGNG